MFIVEPKTQTYSDLLKMRLKYLLRTRKALETKGKSTENVDQEIVDLAMTITVITVEREKIEQTRRVR